jgi:two-component system, LuxR family, sensor kinase FixL
VSTVDAIWVFVASACMTLSLIHLVIGVRQPRASHLWFALLSVSAAALAVFELELMRASSPGTYGLLVRWIHVPIFVLVGSLVLFIRSFFNAGRPWLAWSVIGFRGLASLVINFLHDPNLNYETITGIVRVPFLGETVAVAEGTVSPWTRVAEVSSILLLVFLLDATRTVWRRGQRERALVMGGSALIFVLVSGGNSALIHAGVLKAPYLISVPYFVIIAGMSYELTSDVLHASELSRKLSLSEEALRDSTRRLALAATAVDLGFWDWSSETDEMWMTPEGRALRGYSRDEQLDLKRFLSPVHPEDQAELLRTIGRALKGGESEMEYRIVRPDGQIRWLYVRCVGDGVSSGETPQVRGLSIDITSRKLAQAEAQRRQSEIAHLSRVTTLGELSGSLAHELNQPLTAILSNAQAGGRFLDRADNDPSEIREILEDIAKESKRAGEVIRRLRLLLKKGEVKPEPIDLAEIAGSVLSLMHSELINRGVATSSEIDGGLPPVLADRVQIEQVLFNLVTNACDAMAETPPAERRLLLRVYPRNGNGIEVSLTDRGLGIGADDLERVFEPFVTTKVQGMGLGLAVCRSIITAHGGRLWATNNAGRGATFHFHLPATPRESA